MKVKTKSQFECQNCGTQYPVWQGHCHSCQQWNSLLEISQDDAAGAFTSEGGGSRKKTKPTRIVDISQEKYHSVSSGIRDFDAVLGKGFVKGSVCLLGGEPGIGKSTGLLQVAQKMAFQGLNVLYVTGEESASQIQYRSHRVGQNPETLWVLSDSNMGAILSQMKHLNPDVVILDSIQMVHHESLSAMEGTVTQVRFCAQVFIQWIKAQGAIGILIGHITKEGNLAGPKVLEHMVDVILSLEGERNERYRLLRCFKNRYSSTQEIGVFEMKQEGLSQVDNPSAVFMDEMASSHPGSVIVPVLQGNRVFLVEIQALVVSSHYGMAKRSVVGVDSHRATLMIAALDKSAGVKLGDKDIFLNVIGGLKVSEPAADLGMVVAIISSLQDRPLRDKIGVVGEIGLTGEIRPVPLLQKRLLELSKLGFTHCMVSVKAKDLIEDSLGLKLVFVSHIHHVIEYFIGVPAYD